MILGDVFVHLGAITAGLTGRSDVRSTWQAHVSWGRDVFVV
jgi:hypothetical protein